MQERGQRFGGSRNGERRTDKSDQEGTMGFTCRHGPSTPRPGAPKNGAEETAVAPVGMTGGKSGAGI
jgi:hypothetical protein